MSTLNIPTVELVSTIITVPFKGSPSSEDYNDSSVQNLYDHATLANTINDEILPVLNTLPSTASSGLLGATVYTDTSVQTPLTYNSVASTYLTVAQSLSYLQGLVKIAQTNLINLNTQIGIINSKLSSTNQNDISLALSSFQTALQVNAAQIAALNSAIAILSVGGLTITEMSPDGGAFPGTVYTFSSSPSSILNLFYMGNYVPRNKYTYLAGTLTLTFETYAGDNLYALVTL